MRTRHFDAVPIVQLNRRLISLVAAPAAANNTIRARTRFAFRRTAQRRRLRALFRRQFDLGRLGGSLSSHLESRLALYR